MNLKALEEIFINHPELLESSANENNVPEQTIFGIAEFAYKNSYEKLSDKQQYHFNNCIRHLIEDVQCSGYNHEYEEEPRECPATLDDDDLVEYYQNDGKYCESCEGQASSDSHSKESFFCE
ncbi:hypothetical protein WNY81_02710 [Shewanella frigidimarina]|uniref:hypothetical protein n=1 Tax=Shewanella frigidimarina TaxID=56812 RepID=UPI00316FC9A9